MVIMTPPELQHPDHPAHLLNWTPRIETPYICDGCEEEGFHSCYQCNENGCHFHLHQHCGTVNHLYRTTHKFYHKTQFIFINNSRLQNGTINWPCVACGKGVQRFRYHSRCNKYVIHPCCFDLPMILKTDDQVPVSLRLHKKAEFYWINSKCLKCENRKISNDIHGWVYVSDSRGIIYHVRCIQDWILDQWKKDQLEDNRNGVLGRQISQMTIEHNLPERKVLKISWKVVKAALQLVITTVLGQEISVIGPN